MAKHLLLIIFGLLSVCAFSAEIEKGKVVKVTDGDTFTVLTEGQKQVRVRIYGIDAPESKQAFGQKSRLYLADMIAGKTVYISVINTDKYGRKVAKVKTDKVKDVDLEMIKSGMAWHYDYYDHTKEYARAQEKAKQKKLGLWQDKKPINPYNFRKMKKR